ncbi:FAD binding domain-containing protein [Terrabacter sp. BE26]|uniref:FAD binding domain-containing protein n=1 Tax=Terrabacter sp. BE26 TaxID=2898152 RepID=UPI0035BE2DD7
MKPAPFVHHAPRTVEEAVAVLAEVGHDGKVLAGGQSLIPLLNMRLASPAHLVDLNRVAGLDAIAVTHEFVRVGALVRHAGLERSREAYAALPLLRQAVTNVAHPAIRNRGTTVGSIAHADAAGEMPAILALTCGTVEVVGPAGPREIACADFFLGPLETCLDPEELVVAVRFGRLPAGTGTAFTESARRHGDYAIAGVGVGVTLTDGVVSQARASFVSVTAVPSVLDLTSALAGVEPGSDAWERGLDAAAEAVHAYVDPEDDIHASADYRRMLAAELTRRALPRAVEHGTQSAEDRSGPTSSGHFPPSNGHFPPSSEHLDSARAQQSAHATGEGGEGGEVTVTVNGIRHSAVVPARRLLSDFLRHDLELTGTHVGCEHGVCGACTVLVDGRPMRSCLMFAVTAQDHEITTVEGLCDARDARRAPTGESMNPVQQAFAECHGLQCGFCTPGFLTTITAYLDEHPHPTSEQAREAISGNLCRCTGYQNIVKSVLRAAEIRAERATERVTETAAGEGA